MYDAAARELLIRSQGEFRIRDIEAAKSSSIEPPKEIGAASIGTLIRRARRSQGPHEIRVFAASLADIKKALGLKDKQVPYEKLPKELRKWKDLFDLVADNYLLPYRLGVDYIIPLTKGTDGKELEVPWGPLYGMSREELLVLRKTLTDLLDKNYIRASSSTGGAPVLFVKKPRGGLRFYCDFKALNAITKRDRYPLPLIRETLTTLLRAR